MEGSPYRQTVDERCSSSYHIPPHYHLHRFDPERPSAAAPVVFICTHPDAQSVELATTLLQEAVSAAAPVPAYLWVHRERTLESGPQEETLRYLLFVTNRDGRPAPYHAVWTLTNRDWLQQQLGPTGAELLALAAPFTRVVSR